MKRVREVQSGAVDEAFEIVELKDGRTFEQYISPQRIDGRTVGTVVNLRDITERKRTESERRTAENALRESQALYHSLVDQLPAGVFRKDKEGRYVFVNPWFCRIRGFTPEQVIGKLPCEITSPHTGASWSRQFATQGMDHHAQIMQTGRQIEMEEEHPGLNGQPQYLHVVKSPVSGPDGTILGSQGVLLDITQRKLMEAELAHERHLLRALLDNSPDQIYFKDLQSRFLRSSKAQAANFGVESADEIIGKTDFDFFSDEHARPAFEDEQEIIRTGRPLIGKIEKEVLKDGRINWVLASKMPLRNADGKIIGTFGITKDITAIKEAEAKLEEAHKQLVESSRRAGMAEVATGVLHNVGNVLNSINVAAGLLTDQTRKSKIPFVGRVAALLREHAADMTEFMSRDPKGLRLPAYLSELAEHLATEQTSALEELAGLHKNVEHIKDIITVQQSYAKVAGLTSAVKVTDLVEDALRMNKTALARHDVQLVRDFEEVLPEVTVDRHKVLQILVNLIRNAKFACDDARRDDKQLTVRVANGGERIKISVIDNGVGIPPENLTRIFTHGFTTRKTGHGFGLHSGALAAREMGGTLLVHSDGPGKGATFTLELPINPPGLHQ